MVSTILKIMFTLLLALNLYCKKEGPAEKAGKQIDKSAKQLEDSSKKALDSLNKNK